MNLSTTEKKIYDLLEPVAASMGLEIVKVNLHGTGNSGGRIVLDIALDKLEDVAGQERITIKDCQTASNHFSAVLDVEEIMSDKYYLEVSSAGVERPLVKLSDFARFKGKLANVKLHSSYLGTKNIPAILAGIVPNADLGEDSQKVLLKSETLGDIEMEYSNIKSAKLAFTDEMFRETIAKSKDKKIADKKDKPAIKPSVKPGAKTVVKPGVKPVVKPTVKQKIEQEQ